MINLTADVPFISGGGYKEAVEHAELDVILSHLSTVPSRITTNDPDGEVALLQAEVYEAQVQISVHEITALTRYSDRMWSFDP